MKLIVGLGNPSREYEATRHNIGFRVIDEVGARWSIDLRGEKFHAWAGTGAIHGERVLLLKPTTFMNRSGRAVQAAGRFYRLELEDLLVVSDDFALPLGRLRVRTHGSAGSHKGLGDIIGRLGTEEFARLRVGIGEAIGDPARYVLARFAPEEEAIVGSLVTRAADAVECWLSRGPQEAMNPFNGMMDSAEQGGAA